MTCTTWTHRPVVATSKLSLGAVGRHANMGDAINFWYQRISSSRAHRCYGRRREDVDLWWNLHRRQSAAESRLSSSAVQADIMTYTTWTRRPGSIAAAKWTSKAGTPTWTTPSVSGSIPAGRRFHSAAMDSWGRMWLFAGDGSSGWGAQWRTAIGLT